MEVKTRKMYAVLMVNEHIILVTDWQGLWWQMVTKANAVVHVEYKDMHK